MKKSLLALSLLGAFGVAHASDFTDTARVISSTPIYDRVSEPRQECWTETVNEPAQERGIGGGVLGGVAGGILGSQVGGGNGNTVATAAGAVVGTIAGDRVANPDSNRSMGGAVVGGVVGGLLGSQVGGGSGNKAATAAGAVAGTLIGDRVANPSVAQTRQVQRCKQVDSSREVVKGYSVVYRYNGKDITTTLPYQVQPGTILRIGVSVLGEDNGASRYDNRRDENRYDERRSNRYEDRNDGARDDRYRRY
jgi:uncharacterized protein YcfJ